ncbi:protein of unknown function DUF262 [Burkholderia sp. MR1]|nr:protein of unknown function DUF262 [Burkholderia sp. MR1]
MASDSRVHLDHLIERQSLRYSGRSRDDVSRAIQRSRSDSNIRFDDIRQQNGWFDRLVKPDFQRATCAWDAQACVTFLTSVIRRRIIPSIILWRSTETGLVFVLDGAHRLSVLRAWMIDDWGDKASDFYRKNENYKEIIATAEATRNLVREKVGDFSHYEQLSQTWDQIARNGGAPRATMSEVDAERAIFYSDIVNSTRTLHAQWEEGDYSAAEESFLAINRQGEPLDDVEQLLIEHRNGSMCRLIMSIASAGSAGHYWPAPVQDLPKDILTKLERFSDRCTQLHRILFVPPFDSKIVDINVPFIVAPGHFRPHQHLIEFIPLLVQGGAVGADRIPELLARDAGADVSELVLNADALLGKVENSLRHLTSAENNSLSLSIVPLIYWYNRRGGFVRALMYAWCHWLLAGDETQMQERKIAFAVVRGRLEEILIEYKDEFAEIQHRVGAGLKSLVKLTAVIQDLVTLLLKQHTLDPDELDKAIAGITGSSRRPAKGKGSTARRFSKGNRAEINVRELLGASVKCEICGGVVDLKQGLQYDHKSHWATGGLSDADNGRPTHPFCNLFRQRITAARENSEEIHLPPLLDGGILQPYRQLNLFDPFPGE